MAVGLDASLPPQFRATLDRRVRESEGKVTTAQLDRGRSRWPGRYTFRKVLAAGQQGWHLLLAAGGHAAADVTGDSASLSADGGTPWRSARAADSQASDGRLLGGWWQCVCPRPREQQKQTSEHIDRLHAAQRGGGFLPGHGLLTQETFESFCPPRSDILKNFQFLHSLLLVYIYTANCLLL